MWVLALNQLQSSPVVRNRQERFSVLFCFISFSITQRGRSTLSFALWSKVSSEFTYKDVPFLSSGLYDSVLDFTHTHTSPIWALGFLFCLPPSMAHSLHPRRTSSPPYDLKQKPACSYICFNSTLLQCYSRENTGNYSILISASLIIRSVYKNLEQKVRINKMGEKLLYKRNGQQNQNKRVL